MLPEIESLLARSNTNRYLLAQLLAQVPDEHWINRAGDDAWTAHDHLAHLATIDDVTAGLLRKPSGDAYRLDAALLELRRSRMLAVSSESVESLVQRLEPSRARLVARIAGLDERRLAIPVTIAMPGAWPPEQQLSLRAYLAAWAEHDAEHTAAIRAAIAKPPGPADLALAARFGRN